jgi:hypothetical protein
MLLAFLGLIAVAAATLGHYVANGGFFLDDWADSAGTLYTPGGRTLGNILSYFIAYFDYRPVLIVFTPVKYSILGASITLNLAWSVFFAVLVALLVYTILRTLSVPWYHAGLIAALTLVYPWYDSLRFWASANPPLLGVFLAFAGIQAALAGVLRCSWRWHAVALVLYLLSVLAYELAAPLILVAGSLYVAMSSWKEARFRWVADIAVVAAGLLWVGTHTTRTVSGFSDNLHHLWEIVEGGKEIVTWTFEPLGPTPRSGLVFAAIGIVLAVGIAAYVLRERRGDGREGDWGMRQWLLLAGAGFAVTALGWVMLIPADPYYTPSVFGITNRVNALAGFGLVIFAYALVGIGVAAAASFWRPLRRWSAFVTIGLMLLLGAAWIHVLERHAEAWETAAGAERTALDQIERTYPQLPPGSNLFTAGYPTYETLGVPIFISFWDLTGAIHDEYGTDEVTAFPVVYPLEMQCRSHGVGLVGEGAPEATASYGTAKLINLSTGFHAEPRDQRECEAVVRKFPAGAQYVRYDY